MRGPCIFLLVPILAAACAGRIGPHPTGSAAPRSPAAPAASPAPADAAPAASPSPAPAATSSPTPTPAPIDFATQVRPVLEEKCTPCHFTGGRMHERLPFDKEATIRLLGEKLFTRLSDPVDQELVRKFLYPDADPEIPLPKP